MGYFRQFKDFDPVNSPASSATIFSGRLDDVLRRARALLRGRTREQITSATESADVFIDNFFAEEKAAFIPSLIKQNWIFGLLPEEQRHEAGVEHLIENWPPECDDERPSYANSENTSDFDALREGINSFVIGEDDFFPGAKDYEYFAVLAIWKVADAVRSVRDKSNQVNALLQANSLQLLTKEEESRARLVSAVGFAFEALESLTFAESLREAAAIRDENVKLRSANFSLRNDATVTERAEQIARATISANARKASHQAHIENRAIKATYRDWYEKNRSEFSSAAKAAEAAHDQRLAIVAYRTIYEWMLNWDREARPMANHSTGDRGDRTLGEGSA